MGKNQTAKEINNSINARYDRVTVLIPKGTRYLVEDSAKYGYFTNVSAYIRGLLEADLCHCVDWESYRHHENYGILLRMAEYEKAQPVTDYRRRLR